MVKTPRCFGAGAFFLGSSSSLPMASGAAIQPQMDEMHADEEIRTWMDRMNKIRMEDELADAEATKTRQ
jgi:hypothetical protein